MRTTHRLASVGAMAALAVTLTACGGGTTPAAPAMPSSMPSMSAPTSSAAGGAAGGASGGVTTPDQAFGPACSALPQGDEPGGLTAMGPQPVATAASTNPILTSLVTVVGVANLGDTLNQAPAITVFAPSDQAFTDAKAELGPPTFDSIVTSAEALSPVLQYHVVGTRYDSAGIVEAGSLPTLAGANLTIGGTAEAPTVTDGAGRTANVLCGNIPTSNATVFVIDKVLLAAAP